jgi:hypothetical protein
MPKKNDKRPEQRGSDSSSLSTYIIVVLVSIIVILLAVLSAYLLNPERSGKEVSVSEKLIKNEEVKRLRFWSVILEVWNESGKTNMTQK